MRTYKIYLIRHGITQGNIEGRYVGSTDISLCEEGVKEILTLKEEYEYPGVGAVYSSPLKRALETARLIYPEITPTTVSGMREYDFGEFENKTLSEVKDDERFKAWFDGDSDPAKTVFSVGEDLGEFEARIIGGFNDIIMDMMKRKIYEAALFAHGGVLMTLLAACGLPKQPPESWAIGNGRGFTALINAALWSNSRLFEVFTPLPYGLDKDSVMLDYQKAFFEE